MKRITDGDVLNRMYNCVCHAMSDSASMWNYVWIHVENPVWNHVDNRVWHHVQNRVRHHVGDRVSDHVHLRVEDRVRERMGQHEVEP